MATQAVEMNAYGEQERNEVVARPHLLVYGWVYLVFAVLTSLALYVIFTFPPSEL